jgi:hypothetical protein
MTDWVTKMLLLALWGDVVAQALLIGMVLVLGVTAAKVLPVVRRRDGSLDRSNTPTQP